MADNKKFLNLLFVLFFVFILFDLSSSIIHGPKLSRKVTREPLIVQVDNLDDPVVDKQLYQKVLQEKESHEKSEERLRRDLPPDTPDGFGHTVILANDHHTFALVHWSGVPKKRIFILTRDRDNQGHSKKSFLWLSTDYGDSFNNVTNLFPDTAVLEWYYISSDADKLIFSDIIHNKIYVTLDEGDTFTEHTVQFSPDKFTFQHSYIPNVASYDSYVLGYDSTQQSLWVSKDTGANWVKLGTNVTRYEWRQIDSTYEDGSTVYFDMKVNDTASLLYNATNTTYNSPQIFDPSLGPFMPHSFALSYRYMFVQKNYTDVGYSSTGYVSPLWVSHHRNPFKAAYFALELDEKHYAMVDGSEGQVLMGVYHDPNNTNLYISEEAGLNYSLSLEHIISPPESDWIDSYPTFDVYVVEGIPGTYLVNKRVYGSSQGSTVISFDKGGEWRSLAPPAVDYLGVPVSCVQPCSLHLHMYVDESHGFQPILTQDSAPNIIMALGNLGTSLNRYNYFGIRLYISDNGGVTWRELAQGYKEFQLINFGVFTAMVDKWRAASYVDSSCDEGVHWERYTFTDDSGSEHINVVRMFTEYGEESQHATIFGFRPYANVANFEWYVTDLNFTTLQLRDCNSSDYFLWRPTDERESQQCILGESLVYERRLPDHCCLINYDYDRPINRSSCVCAYEDFECREGFERVGLNGQCQPMDGVTYPPGPPLSCYEGGYYSYNSPYRRIAGDKCVDGNDTFYSDVTVECPVLPPADMLISTDRIIVGVNYLLNFNLEQNSGAKTVTTYMWYFGDDHNSSLLTSFANAQQQSHAYSAPGHYTVVVYASNNGGNNTAHINITVLDEITDFSLSPLFVKQAEQAVFIVSNVTTKQNTQYYEPANYIWEFPSPDGNRHTSVHYVEYSYTTIGVHQLRVDMTNAATSLLSKMFTITVENGTSTLQLSATVNGSTLPAPRVVPVGQMVIFTVTPQLSDTSYDWEILYTNQTRLDYKITTSPFHGVTFPTKAVFIVRVTGVRHFGTSKVSGVYQSEYIITGATITTPQPVYRINTDITLKLNINIDEGYLYNGNISVKAWLDGQLDAPLVSTSIIANQGKSDLILRFVQSGNLTVYVQLLNDVSSPISPVNLLIAGYNHFGYLRLLFNVSSLPFDYNDYNSQLSLQTAVKNKLLSFYRGIQAWQLRVNVTAEDQSTLNPVFKRAANTMSLVAHVSILPLDLGNTNVQKVHTLSQTIVDDANNGTITFAVNNNNIRASSADLGPSIVIIDPVPGPSTGGKDYKPLAIGLGAGTFVLFVIAMVVIGLVIYYWRKRYRSLEVRYTRLRQGPMRFTFSAEGETIEEEDWKQDQDGEDEQEINEDNTQIQNMPTF